MDNSTANNNLITITNITTITTVTNITTIITSDECESYVIGDSFCDDECNIPEFDFDDGDCCGDNVSTIYCTICECKSI